MNYADIFAASSIVWPLCFVIFLLSILWFVQKFYDDVAKPIVITVRDGVVKSAIPNATAYAVAYLKCSVGMIVVGGICFKATWQPVTVSETLKWAWWDWTIHLGEPVLAMLMYLQGFLDRSMQRADEMLAKKGVAAAVAPAIAAPASVSAAPFPPPAIPPAAG